MSATIRTEPELDEALEELISDNVESSRSFQEAARSRDGGPMALLLREIAQARFAYAADLRRFVRPSREGIRVKSRPQDGLQGWWFSVASSGLGTNARAVFAAADRAEAGIRAGYERVLRHIDGHPASEVIRAQESELRRHRARIRELCGRSAAAVRA